MTELMLNDLGYEIDATGKKKDDAQIRAQVIRIVKKLYDVKILFIQRNMKTLSSEDKEKITGLLGDVLCRIQGELLTCGVTGMIGVRKGLTNWLLRLQAVCLTGSELTNEAITQASDMFLPPQIAHGQRLQEKKDKSTACQDDEKPIERTTKKIKDRCIPQTKTTKALFEDGHIFSWSDKSELKLTEGEKLSVVLSLDLENVQGVTAAVALDEYDYAMYSIICTLVEAGNPVMSLRMIFQAMAGREVTLSEKTKKEMLRSIEKLESLKVRMQKDDNYMFGRVLNCYIGGAVLNGKDTPQCLIVTGTPMLYRMAESQKLIRRVPEAAYSIPDISNTRKMVILKSYIFRRIATKNLSKTILFSTMYEKVLGKEYSKTEQARLRKAAVKIFAHCKEIGWLKEYNIVAAGREKYYGVQIQR